MKMVQLDDDVYAALAERVSGFNETPNDVIRRLIEKSNSPHKKPSSPPNRQTNQDQDLANLIDSLDFRRSDGIDRYFAILKFLHDRSPQIFEKLSEYRRKGGKRINFSKESKEIENSGNSTYPKKIPGTPFFALTNLDNRSKRGILADILPDFGFGSEDIRLIEKELPDSGITRPKRY